MADPEEGVAPDGTILTGAHRDRVPAVFEPVLADAVAVAGQSGASLDGKDQSLRIYVNAVPGSVTC